MRSNDSFLKHLSTVSSILSLLTIECNTGQETSQKTLETDPSKAKQSFYRSIISDNPYLCSYDVNPPNTMHSHLSRPFSSVRSPPSLFLCMDYNIVPLSSPTTRIVPLLLNAEDPN